MHRLPAALTVRAILDSYRTGALLPTGLVAEVLARIRAADDPAIWISLIDEQRLVARARELEMQAEATGEAVPATLPLYGVPFAIKDNIDAAGLPTTAGCPAFAFTPVESATVVKRLEAAGAILIGKTNLDQFATGLVGTRSPYGAVRNPFNGEFISGGSSSGSAAAVARGLAAFALGTDTAGSGRVPAGLCNLVGIKPTRGLASNHGVLPACRSLDCVAVFALDVSGAWTVLSVMAGDDPFDPYSRTVQQAGPLTRPFRLGIPDTLEFFGDYLAAAAFDRALAELRASSRVASIEPVDYTPFREAARLLYQGTWVAERRAALGEFFDRGVEMDATVRQVIAKADDYDAVDTFNHAYRLAALRKDADRLLAHMDILVVPTAPTIYTIEAVRDEPIALNTNLGYYTNFVNLLDLCALSLPAGFRDDGLPCGITLIAPADSDHRLAEFARQVEPVLHRRLGTTALPPVASTPLSPLPGEESYTRVAVVGAHLSGQPFNWQLTERSARLVATTTTAPEYRLYALPETTPPKPGLMRTPEGGRPIEVEVWEMPTRHFGSFVAAIPGPLGIGSLQLSDGGEVKGFICEAMAVTGAEDISAYGGWRAYLSAQRKIATAQA